MIAPPIRNARLAGWLGSRLRAPGSLFRDKDFSVRREYIESFDGERIELLIIEPHGLCEPAPAMVYYHGGGFFFGASWHHYNMARMYAKEGECKLIFPQYRLAPKHPYPHAPEDCYAALKYTYENADTLGIDKEKIAVGGDSAGGALCAAVVQMARDRGDALPLFQMLIYPVTDRRMSSESMRSFVDTPMWNARLSRLMWQGYTGDGEVENIAYASPAEAQSLAGLSPAYVETAEFDCLRDEGIEYARAMSADGVDVELNETKGTMHAYDMVTGAAESRRSFEARINYINKRFGDAI